MLLQEARSSNRRTEFQAGESWEECVYEVGLRGLAGGAGAIHFDTIALYPAALAVAFVLESQRLTQEYSTAQHRELSHTANTCSRLAVHARSSSAATLELGVDEQAAASARAGNRGLTPSGCPHEARVPCLLESCLGAAVAITSTSPACSRHAAEGSSHVFLLRLRPGQRGGVSAGGTCKQ